VISFCDNHLRSVWEECFPARLESEWIIPLSEYRDQWKSLEWARESASDVFVQRVAVPGVAHIGVESTQPVASDTGKEGLAARIVKMKPNTERASSDARDDSRLRIKFSHDGTAHQSQHAAKEGAGRPPAERVHYRNPANPLRGLGRTRQSSRPPEVMDYQCEVLQIQGFDHCRNCASGSFQTDRPSR
jgi:hypothetical protein